MVVNNNIVCYTAIFGDYDILFDPETPSDNVEYICFTDKESIDSEVWKPVQLMEDDLPSNMKNRKVKLLPHLFFPHYDYSVYVDGNIQILGDIESLVSKHLSRDLMACPTHPERDCIYDESEACIRNGKGDPNRIKSQIEKYRKSGYPENYGLSDHSLILRRHNKKKVIKVMESWWKELNEESNRDQLSFGYVAWKLNFDYCSTMEGSRGDSDYFRLHPHKPQGVLGKVFIPWIYLRAKQDENFVYSILYNLGKKIGLQLGIEYPE